VLPVGGTRMVPFEARLVAATNRDLKALVNNDSFRADLYYRLNVIPMHVPSLRERISDIPLLVDKFLTSYADNSGEKEKKFTESAMSNLLEYSWPGNVRELENMVERLCVMSPDEIIDESDLPDFLRTAHSKESHDSATAETFLESDELHPAGTPSISPTLREIEKAYTIYVLEHRAGGQKRLAARLLGINESTLHRRLERYGLTSQEKDESE